MTDRATDGTHETGRVTAADARAPETMTTAVRKATLVMGEVATTTGTVGRVTAREMTREIATIGDEAEAEASATWERR